MSKTWFITGANRGIGAEIAKAALAAGHNVVAGARKPETVAAALGASENLLAVALDVTNDGQIQAAVAAATERFGKIDVLVNNAGYGLLGVFEETELADIRTQYATNVFVLMAVTQAVIPGMREQRSGHVINISSVGGIAGMFGGSVYCSTKFAVEGFSQSLADELKPFGVHLTSVSPGYFRTNFLDSSSVQWPEKAIPDYAERLAGFREFHDNRNGTQPGDPVKLAKVIVELTEMAEPPVSFVAGNDALQWAQNAIDFRTQQTAALRELSGSTDGDWS